MTGLFEGFGIIRMLIILLTLYIPFVTIVLLSKTGIFQSGNEIAKAGKYIAVFVSITTITLIILKYTGEAINWLLLYTCIATIIVVVNLLLNKSKNHIKPIQILGTIIIIVSIVISIFALLQ